MMNAQHRNLHTLAGMILLSFVLTLGVSASDVSEELKWSVVESAGISKKIFPSPVDSETVFVWSTDHFCVSKDRGKTFKALPINAELQSVTALLVDPSHPALLYAGTAERGVFASANEGEAWTKLGGVEAGLAHLHIHSLLFSSYDSSFKTIYALHSAAKPGISMSSDGGKNWKALIRDYGVDGMVLVQSAIFFAGAHPAGGDECGFFRIDPTRGSFRVCVDTPSALNESLFGSRIWLGTADAGIKFSDDFGVTKADVGPPGISVVSMVAGYTSAYGEAEYVFEPHAEGVLVSTDGFKTWKKINNGLYVGEWVTDGACMNISSDGAVLFACINDKLYRGAASESKLIKHIDVQPAAVEAGTGSVTFSCTAAKGSKLELDLSPVGGSAAAGMTEESSAGENANFTFRLPEVPAAVFVQKDRRGAPLPGRVPLNVKAVSGSQTETRLALLTVLKPVRDLILWNGESNNVLSPWGNGVSLQACREKPFSGDTHLRIQVRGAGTAGAGFKPWNGNYDGDDLRYHRLLTFAIRSNVEGPPDLKLAFRDDGRRLGHGDGSRSNEVQLSNYVKSIGTRYCLVSIPLSDFLFGSAAAPEGIAELMFIAPAESPARTYDIDDIAAFAHPHPFIGNLKAVLTPDGQSVAIQALTIGDGGPISVAVFDGDRKFELFDDGKHLDDLAGDGTFGAQIPLAQMAPGTHALRFVATDSTGSAETIFETFLPRKTHGGVAKTAADFKLDPKLAEFTSVAPFQIEDAGVSLDARLLYGNGKLYCALQVQDATFDGKDLPHPESADKLAEGACVELWITSPSHYTNRNTKGPCPADHHIVFAYSAKKTVAILDKIACPAMGVKVDKGYVIVSQIPFAALHAGNEPCDIAAGKSARIEWRVRSASGKRSSWAASDSNAPSDREHWGMVRFNE